MRTWPLLVLVLAAATSCGGGESGFAATYVTAALTENTTSCTGPESAVPVSANELYFQLRDDNLFGVAIVGWHDCTSATVCSDSFDIFRSFGEQVNGSWTATTYSSSSSAPTVCTWTFHNSVLERVDDHTIRVSGSTYLQTDSNTTAALCTIDEAKRRGASMPCVTHTTQTASPTP